MWFDVIDVRLQMPWKVYSALYLRWEDVDYLSFAHAVPPTVADGTAFAACQCKPHVNVTFILVFSRWLH